ncbi:MAG: hypothetical protein AB1568_04585 [Thermodesulfobacteriota bacterium]
MPRKPADKLNRLDTRQAVWDAIRGATGPFTARGIADCTRLGRDTVRDYVTGLRRAGYIEVAGLDGGITGSTYYRLTKDAGAEAPRLRKDGSEVTQGRGREQMWVAMRILRDFSARDLAVHASTEECIVAEATAADYCHHLHRAGYLNRNGNRYRWVAARYTGPKPPMIQRVKQVYDQNIGKVMWSEGGAQ